MRRKLKDMKLDLRFFFFIIIICMDCTMMPCSTAEFAYRLTRLPLIDSQSLYSKSSTQPSLSLSLWAFFSFVGSYKLGGSGRAQLSHKHSTFSLLKILPKTTQPHELSIVLPPPLPLLSSCNLTPLHSSSFQCSHH